MGPRTAAARRSAAQVLRTQRTERAATSTGRPTFAYLLATLRTYRHACVALVLAALASPSLAVAQEAEGSTIASSPPRTVVLADLGLHVIGAGVQYTVTDRVALQAALDWYVPWAQTGDGPDTMGGVLRLRPMIYLTEDAPTGLWLSPFAQLGFLDADRGGARRVGPAGSLGAAAGWAWLALGHLHIALGAGVQVHGAKIPGGADEPSFYGPFPHIDGTLGYAF